MDNGHAKSLERAPLTDEMAKDRGGAPRQKQFGLAHPRRRSRGQQHDTEVESIWRQIGLHGGDLPPPYRCNAATSAELCGPHSGHAAPEPAAFVAYFET